MKKINPTKNDDGTYTVQLGTVIGENIILNEGTSNERIIKYTSKDFIKATGVLRARLERGHLIGEGGSPVYDHRLPRYQNVAKWLKIDLTRSAFSIRNIILEKIGKSRHNKIKTTKARHIRILGKIRPVGPYGDALKMALDDPKQKVVFGLRGYWDTFIDLTSGVEIRQLKHIITWDWVQ